MEESSTARYERLAEEFYRDTGMMAPGKDAPAAMGQPDHGVRRAAFMNWQQDRARKAG